MITRLIVERDAGDDLAHTIEIEADDAGQIWLTDCDDFSGGKLVMMAFPREQAGAICAAIMDRAIAAIAKAKGETL